MEYDLDIVMPVYNEGENIHDVIRALLQNVKSKFRLLICYDFEEDNTIPNAKTHDFGDNELVFVINQGKGAHGAIMSGIAASTSAAVLIMPADDDYNAQRLDAMVKLIADGNVVVTPCRFMPGGCFKGCSLFKATLTRTAAWALRNVARLPTRDGTNGFRMFSLSLLRQIPVESEVGFAYSLEILAKAHRLGLPIAEYPVEWHARKFGESRFRTLRWIPQYLEWLRYAMATTYLRRGKDSVILKKQPNENKS